MKQLVTYLLENRYSVAGTVAAILVAVLVYRLTKAGRSEDAKVHFSSLTGLRIVVYIGRKRYVISDQNYQRDVDRIPVEYRAVVRKAILSEDLGANFPGEFKDLQANAANRLEAHRLGLVLDEDRCARELWCIMSSYARISEDDYKLVAPKAREVIRASIALKVSHSILLQLMAIHSANYSWNDSEPGRLVEQANTLLDSVEFGLRDLRAST